VVPEEEWIKSRKRVRLYFHKYVDNVDNISEMIPIEKIDSYVNDQTRCLEATLWGNKNLEIDWEWLTD
jgi:hypothetical protein